MIFDENNLLVVSLLFFACAVLSPQEANCKITTAADVATTDMKSRSLKRDMGSGTLV